MFQGVFTLLGLFNTKEVVQHFVRLRDMKFFFLFIITLYFFSLTYLSAPHEFLLTDLSFLSAFLAVALLIQYLLVKVLARVGFPENLSLPVLAVLNIVCFNLSVNPSFVRAPLYTGKIPALLICTFIAFTVLRIFDNSRFIARVTNGLFALGTAGVFVLAVNSMNPTIAAPTNFPGRTAAADVALVEFENRPNVYFVSFDSMIPRSLLSKYMGLESTSYHEVLDANFRRFNNFFADRVPSLPSLNSVLALDVDFYESAKAEGRPYDFFTGVRPSPLFEIFKHNGYETSTFYRGYYFGKVKGPHVDNYRIAQQGNSRLATQLDGPDGACEFIDTSGVKAIRFMGYCRLLSRGVFDRVTGGVSERDDQITPLIALMQEGLQKEAPQIVVAYIYSPGHTSADFDPSNPQHLADYRDYYESESVITAGYLNSLVDFLRQKDPTAMLYVFGDHGPGLSRRLRDPKDSEFVVQDRFGVYGGMFPRDACAETFDAPTRNGFKTVAMTARLIIKCLAGGNDAFENEKIYVLPEIAEGFSQRYEDNVYE